MKNACLVSVRAAVVAAALSFVCRLGADTIAWWHFDECEPGTTAPANTVADGFTLTIR